MEAVRFFWMCDAPMPLMMLLMALLLVVPCCWRLRLPLAGVWSLCWAQTRQAWTSLWCTSPVFNSLPVLTKWPLLPRVLPGCWCPSWPGTGTALQAVLRRLERRLDSSAELIEQLLQWREEAGGR